jgi:hypothetical protein
MQTQVIFNGKFYSARKVFKPHNTTNESRYTFGSPYKRVRKDKDGLYVNSQGKRVPVAIVLS